MVIEEFFSNFVNTVWCNMIKRLNILFVFAALFALVIAGCSKADELTRVPSQVNELRGGELDDAGGEDGDGTSNGDITDPNDDDDENVDDTDKPGTGGITDDEEDDDEASTPTKGR